MKALKYYLEKVTSAKRNADNMVNTAAGGQVIVIMVPFVYHILDRNRTRCTRMMKSMVLNFIEYFIMRSNLSFTYTNLLKLFLKNPIFHENSFKNP